MKLKLPTPRQLEIFHFIVSFYKENKFYPTDVQILEHFNYKIKTRAFIRKSIHRLDELNYLKEHGLKPYYTILKK